MTDKFRKMCELYRIFASDFDCDFSEGAMQEAFEYETHGKGKKSGIFASGSKPNGYLVGKKWLNVQVSAWREELEQWKRNPFRHEIQCITDAIWSDRKYKDHHEWLIDVLGLRDAVNNLKAKLREINNERLQFHHPDQGKR